MSSIAIRRALLDQSWELPANRRDGGVCKAEGIAYASADFGQQLFAVSVRA